MKKNGVFKYPITWINLENRLNERNKIPMTIYCMF